MIEALVFDFDGVIVDTEGPAYRSWQEIYREHGHELPLERWAAAIGTVGGFDAAAHLEGLAGRPLDRPGLRARRLELKHRLVADTAPRPGVVGYLEEARRRGLGLAVASSDTTEWVTGHLRRLGLADRWDAILCADGDQARAKPHPTLYGEAVAALGVPAPRAVAFEDSPNGIWAAKAAGLLCVAVPNPLTARLDLSRADLVIPSFEERPLGEVLAEVGYAADSPPR